MGQKSSKTDQKLELLNKQLSDLVDLLTKQQEDEMNQRQLKDKLEKNSLDAIAMFDKTNKRVNECEYQLNIRKTKSSDHKEKLEKSLRNLNRDKLDYCYSRLTESEIEINNLIKLWENYPMDKRKDISENHLVLLEETYKHYEISYNTFMRLSELSFLVE